MTQDGTCICGGTGWITRVDHDGYGYDEPCPRGCPGAQPAEETA